MRLEAAAEDAEDAVTALLLGSCGSATAQLHPTGTQNFIARTKSHPLSYNAITSEACLCG